jgi:hypothetical protein
MCAPQFIRREIKQEKNVKQSVIEKKYRNSIIISVYLVIGGIEFDFI